MRNAASRAVAAIFGCLLGAALLSGCGTMEPDLGGDAAKRLQSQVRAVTEHAAADDHTAALDALEDLTDQLDAAAANGEVSFKRHQSISKAIEAVRSDLSAAQAEAQIRAAAEAAAAAANASPPPAGPSTQESPLSTPGSEGRDGDERDDDGAGKDDHPGKGRGKDD